MGGLISGIASLFGGNPTETEQNNLAALGGFETNAGENATKAGLDYYSSILSGDPTRIATTLAPEIDTQAKQLQQNRLTTAEFGNRSGGATASNQAAEAGARGNIIDLIGRLQQGAAGAELGAGTTLLPQATTANVDNANLALQNKQRVDNAIGGIASGVGQIIAAPFTGGASLGYGDMSLPGFGGGEENPYASNFGNPYGEGG